MRRSRDRSPDADGISRLMLFFAIVYTVEGIGQAKVGVIWQPLTHYLKESQGWTPVQIAASLAVLDVPWVVKPLYGMLSDFLPLFGYRRRSYLLLANVGAIAAFLWTTQALTPAPIVFALLLTSIAMAASSTVCGALLVENGQKHSASAAFINQQWLWFNVAVMVATLLGGELIEYLSPEGALHAAAGLRRPRRLRSSSAACGWWTRRPRASTLPSSGARCAGFSTRSDRARCGWSLRSCSSTTSVPVSARRSIST